MIVPSLLMSELYLQMTAAERGGKHTLVFTVFRTWRGKLFLVKLRVMVGSLMDTKRGCMRKRGYMGPGLRSAGAEGGLFLWGLDKDYRY